MTVASSRLGTAVEQLAVSTYQIPIDAPESDGTYEWESTTVVVVEARAGGETGLGYTYGPAAIGKLIEDELEPVVRGREAGAVEDTWEAVGRTLRNAGRPGMGSMARAAVDVALWDLRARLLGLSLAEHAGLVREACPMYGSGGFTSYSLERLQEQLAGWVEQGIARVKMKVSREPADDPARLAAAREAIGGAELYVDSNGALTRQQALHWAERFAWEWGVTWFEEPVSSADLEGLRLVRERAPAGLDVAAGEYAYVLADFRNLLSARAVHCLQADVTRCGGITGLLQAARLAERAGLDLSAHGAPALSAHAVAAVPRLRHLEYFHDHVRVERMLFDGVLEPEDGHLRPDLDRPGHGLVLKRADAEQWQI